MNAVLVNAGGVVLNGQPLPRLEARTTSRPWTEDVRHDGGTTIHVKRACNGCGARLGDVVDRDFRDIPTHDCPLDGDEDGTESCWCSAYPMLTDVRDECPVCTPQPGKTLAVAR